VGHCALRRQDVGVEIPLRIGRDFGPSATIGRSPRLPPVGLIGLACRTLMISISRTHRVRRILSSPCGRIGLWSAVPLLIAGCWTWSLDESGSALDGGRGADNARLLDKIQNTSDGPLRDVRIAADGADASSGADLAPLDAEVLDAPDALTPPPDSAITPNADVNAPRLDSSTADTTRVPGPPDADSFPGKDATVSIDDAGTLPVDNGPLCTDTACTCPTGAVCEIDCTKIDCGSRVLDCGGASECSIVCEGSDCRGDIFCGRNGCDVHCSGSACRGRILCGEGDCNIDCRGAACSNEIRCGAGACRLNCREGACQGQIDCGSSSQCAVNCSSEPSDSPGSCRSVACGSGNCDVTCSGASCHERVACEPEYPCHIKCRGQSCTGEVTCNDACECRVECDSGACGEGPKCRSHPQCRESWGCAADHNQCKSPCR
jgi:hypothetical protein